MECAMLRWYCTVFWRVLRADRECRLVRMKTKGGSRRHEDWADWIQDKGLDGRTVEGNAFRYRRSFLYGDERRVCVKFSFARGVTWMYMIFEGIIGDLAGKELGIDKIWKNAFMGSSRKYQGTPQCIDKNEDVVDRWSRSARLESIIVRSTVHHPYEDGCMERSMKEFLRDYVLSLVGVAVSYAILVEFFMIKEEIVDRFEPEEESW
ncbi:hypothetical protein L1887_40731 [Cichorium endivia]|nr:hypothetical protein L1887_40731 [Cichorium endivia]